MVTKTFGELLYCPESEYLEEFPSPEALKKRVMISTKPPEHHESTHHNRSSSSNSTRTTSTSTSKSSFSKQNSKDSDEDEEKTADHIDQVYLSND